MAKDETASNRFALRVLKELLVEILLRLWFVAKYLLEVVEEGQVFWGNHHAPLRHLVILCPTLKERAVAACDGRASQRLVAIVPRRVWDLVLSTQLLQLRVELEQHDWAVQ